MCSNLSLVAWFRRMARLCPTCVECMSDEPFCWAEDCNHQGWRWWKEGHFGIPPSYAPDWIEAEWRRCLTCKVLPSHHAYRIRMFFCLITWTRRQSNLFAPSAWYGRRYPWRVWQSSLFRPVSQNCCDAWNHWLYLLYIWISFHKNNK